MVADFVGSYVGDYIGIVPRQQGYSCELYLTRTVKRGASEGAEKGYVWFEIWGLTA